MGIWHSSKVNQMCMLSFSYVKKENLGFHSAMGQDIMILNRWDQITNVISIMKLRRQRMPISPLCFLATSIYKLMWKPNTTTKFVYALDSLLFYSHHCCLFSLLNCHWGAIREKKKKTRISWCCLLIHLNLQSPWPIIIVVRLFQERRRGRSSINR